MGVFGNPDLNVAGRCVFRCGVAIFGLLISLPAVGTCSELVVNGGFETGDFTGWTTSTTAALDVCSGGTALETCAYDGTYGAAMGTVGSLGYLSQTLATTPGQSYDLSFWLESDGDLPNELSVSWGGDTLYDQTSLPSFTWTQYNFDVTATSASTVISFGERDDPGYFHLDDVSVMPASTAAAPEPGTALLLIPGALLLGVGRLRRRR